MSGQSELEAYVNGTVGDNVESARHRVAALGPAIVPDIIRTTLLHLRHLGTSPVGGMFIEQTRTRIERLVTEIATVSPQSGNQVGTLLAQSLSSQDWHARALAALLCFCDGIPRNTYSQAVVRCFTNDSRDEVRVAAAISMATLVDVPQQLMEASIQVVLGLVAQVRSESPDLADFVESRMRGRDEGEQNVRIAYSAIFQVIANNS